MSFSRMFEDESDHVERFELFETIEADCWEVT